MHLIGYKKMKSDDRDKIIDRCILQANPIRYIYPPRTQRLIEAKKEEKVRKIQDI